MFIFIIVAMRFVIAFIKPILCYVYVYVTINQCGCSHFTTMVEQIIDELHSFFS